MSAGRRIVAAELVTSADVWGVVLAIAVHSWREGGPGAAGLISVSWAVPSALGGVLLGGLAGRASLRTMLLGSGCRRR